MQYTAKLSIDQAIDKFFTYISPKENEIFVNFFSNSNLG
jgi:hypothetical protein